MEPELPELMDGESQQGLTTRQVSQASLISELTESVLGRQRLLAFGAATMAWMLLLLASVTVWISAPPSEDNYVCPLTVWKVLGVTDSTFSWISKWTLVVVNVFPMALAAVAFWTNTFLRSRPSCDRYSIFMIAVVAALALSTADQFWSSSFDTKQAMSFRAALQISLLVVEGLFLKYISGTSPTMHPDSENLLKLPCCPWVLLFSSFCILLVRFVAVSFLASDSASDIINATARLLSQNLTAAAEAVAYYAIHLRMASLSHTIFAEFAQKALLGIAVLLFINVAQIFEQIVLLLRVLLATGEMKLEIFDEEITLMLSLINITVPLTYLVMGTPNWRCRGSHHQSMCGNAKKSLRNAMLWVSFGIYLKWGARMTCDPKNVNAADHGSWLYVVAKSSAATFYLDVPLLFLSVFDGAISLALKTMGFYISKDETVEIHKTVATRLVVMASIHSLAHLLWILRDVRSDSFHKYAQDVWQGHTFKMQLPIFTGVFMWLSVLSTVAAYSFKESAYGYFRAAKRVASILFLSLGLFHGSGAALGLPTLWLFVLWVIIYYGLDAGLHRVLFHDNEVEIQLLEGDRPEEMAPCILCLKLPNDHWGYGYLLLQVCGVESWQPFTVVLLRFGRAELHILMKPSVRDGAAGQYANWSFHAKARAVFALWYENPLPIRWTGPFGGKLSNSDLYSMVDGVIFVCWGTGFTTVTQGLSSLMALMRSRAQVPPVYVFWRGSGSLYEQYYQQKVVPICAEYQAQYQAQVENVLQTWMENPDVFRPWNRDEFKTQVMAKIRWCNQNGGQHRGKVFVGMCGGSQAVGDMANAIWDELGIHGTSHLVTMDEEVFG